MSNKSKHTPAPWKVLNNRNSTDPDKYGHYIVDEQGYIVAEIPSYNNTKPSEANARLIAAAPELLEALVAIRAIQKEEWDNPILKKYGNIPALTTDIIARIADEALRAAE